MKSYKIRVMPQNKEFTVSAEKYKNLLEILLANGIDVYASCGGNGSCGKCKVKIHKGEYFCKDTHFISEKEKKKKV